MDIGIKFKGDCRVCDNVDLPRSTGSVDNSHVSVSP